MALGISCMGSFNPLIASLPLVEEVRAEPSDEKSEGGGLHRGEGQVEQVRSPVSNLEEALGG